MLHDFHRFFVRKAAVSEEGDAHLTPGHRIRHTVLLALFAFLMLGGDPWVSSCKAAPQGDPPSPDLKTIVDLQPFRQSSSIRIKSSRDEARDKARDKEGLATLINLNPHINVWYLLRLQWNDGTPEEVYHLESANPWAQRFLLEDNHPNGLVLAEGQDQTVCDLWGPKSQPSLKNARKSGAPYVPLCGGKLYLRNPTKGHRTGIEAATDFLRDKVPGGEKVVGFVRDTFFRYLYTRKAEERVESKPGEGLPQKEPENAPSSALMDPNQANRLAKPNDLGIEIQGSSPDGMVLGAWYAVKDNPGIYVSLIVPNGIAPEVLSSYRKIVNGLDKVEAEGLVYLVAFDLGRFDLKYALGTEHPRVGWSDHILDRVKDPSLPGPDGIGTIAPLVSTGIINPVDAQRTVASFTAGFKRTHGAFKYGDLALKNHGSHYGFMEEGVIFSKLQPGLATIYVFDDGRTDLKTWAEDDNDLLPRINCALQNGVPIIDGFDPKYQLSIPGPLVGRWGEGNWSGSNDRKLRTLRAGMALQESRGRRFLIYAFFWSATPSAMARVFQGYQCRYAMHTDMNALEHTYLAIYKRRGSNLYVQHLIRGMSEVDMVSKGQYIPRFLGYSDDRDFFYLTSKEAP